MGCKKKITDFLSIHVNRHIKKKSDVTFRVTWTS